MGFDDLDDAGVFDMGDGTALVQTMDFFTPVVDDAHAYGQIAAANALSDVYAMGGKPLTAMNIACFDPTMAEPETWANILKGMADKCAEAGVAVVGGHSVEDPQPKFGLSVTGVVKTDELMTNSRAKPGDGIYLSKPLGIGIITTAVKFGGCPESALNQATEWMSTLNNEASEKAVAAGAKCATDVTGFGLAGHCYNVARASNVGIQLDAASLPILEGVREMIDAGYTTGGANKTSDFLAGDLRIELPEGSTEFYRAVVTDPQTSGGLAIFSSAEIAGYPRIGTVVDGLPKVVVTSS